MMTTPKLQHEIQEERKRRERRGRPSVAGEKEEKSRLKPRAKSDQHSDKLGPGLLREFGLTSPNTQLTTSLRILCGEGKAAPILEGSL